VKSRVVLIAVAVAAIAAALGAGLYNQVRPKLTAPERGRRLAEATGCFGCHGPEGTHGTPNVGRSEQTVPDWQGSLMMYADNEEDVREWIRDGVTKSRRASASWQAARKSGALHMPDFGDRLSAAQIEDLVAFVMASAGRPEPTDSTALAGRDRAETLGCTGCHGVGGRLGRPNHGSFKGYVPPWDGADFPELVNSKDEFRQWVEHGVSDRFQKNALAEYFLRRADLHMPRFEKHLEPGDVNLLWAYVQWLRSPHTAAATAPADSAAGADSSRAGQG
jgi:mono/diheme cytochrome c family protein